MPERFPGGGWLELWGHWLPDMRLDINLASQPYQNLRTFWMRWIVGLAALALLTIGLLVFTVGALIKAHHQQQAIQAIQDNIDALSERETKAKAFLNQPDNRSTRDRSQFLNDLFHRKAFSWTQVFQDLERVMPARLHVVSIHPELTKSNQLEIKLVVGGDTHQHALELVKKMEDSKRFQGTQINQETRAAGGQSASGDAVQFDISAQYAPEAPGENAGGSQ
jgi:type IV pilus assembly protein PilN